MAVKKYLHAFAFLGFVYFPVVLCVSQRSHTHYKLGNIYINSIPKCGTHLLTKCIELLTKRPLIEFNPQQKATFLTENRLPSHATWHHFFATHMQYTPQAISVFKKRKFKMFLIYRDPRDKAISQVYWIYRGGWMNEQADSPLRKLPFKKLLKYVIKRIRRDYRSYMPWIKHPLCVPIRFESLIGPKGGGSLEAQMREIKKIAKHINLPLTRELLSQCVTHVFGGSPTFREGKIGSWVKHFDPEIKALFKKEANDILVGLGYEKGLAW